MDSLVHLCLQCASREFCACRAMRHAMHAMPWRHAMLAGSCAGGSLARMVEYTLRRRFVGAPIVTFEWFLVVPYTEVRPQFRYQSENKCKSSLLFATKRVSSAIPKDSLGFH